MRECDVFVLVLSTASQESLWVPKEVDFALSNRKPIIPVYIDKSDIADAFNFRLSNIQRIEAFEKASDAYEILIGRLKVLAPDDKNSAKQRNQTSVTNAHVATNTVVRTNVCPISFNTMPGKEYISVLKRRIQSCNIDTDRLK
nr:toll/interleukin-1 receptor domain-containing protein [uncultured Lachnoanaerobaculum sp.]